MKTAFTWIVIKCGVGLASLSALIAAWTANSACLWIYHQPEEPREVQELKKK